MHALEQASKQLDTVSSEYDWSVHLEEMKTLDGDIAAMEQRINLLLTTRDFLQDLDGLCVHRINAGEMSPDHVYESWRNVIALMHRAFDSVSRDAEGFVRAGIRFAQMAKLRRMGEDPEAGLHMAQVVALAHEMDAGEGINPRECAMNRL